jgi:hypothetical protein
VTPSSFWPTLIQAEDGIAHDPAASYACVRHRALFGLDSFEHFEVVRASARAG